MRELAGTLLLARLALRRNRVVIAVCVAVVVGVVAISASSLEELYPTAADRADFAASIHHDRAVIAFRGPDRGLESEGGLLSYQVGGSAAAAAALVSLLLAGRQTRGDEESGRGELVRAAATGRLSPTAAALVMVAAIDVAIAAGVAVVGLGFGLPAGGSVLLGVAVGLAVLVFGAAAAGLAQLTEGTRAACGLAGAALGAAYVLRAAGDVREDALSWLSPLGWSQQTLPYVEDRWWVLLLPAGATAALSAVALALVARRDFGAGILRARPGAPRAGAALVHPAGLALRLQRGALLGWTSGVVLLGAAAGVLAADIGDFVGDNDRLHDWVERVPGGDLVQSFFSSMLLMLALGVAGYAVSAVLRLKAEEGAGRAGPLRATAVGRWRWAASHLLVALGGTMAGLALAGLAMGAASAARSGDADDMPRLTLAALAYVPAVWVVAGLAVALFGLAPRLTAVAGVVFGACATVGFLGPLLGLPSTVVDASPFAQTPGVPAEPFAVGPTAVLSVAALALVGVGLAGFRRRDVG